VLVE
jgi:hypothetical protein